MYQVQVQVHVAFFFSFSEEVNTNITDQQERYMISLVTLITYNQFANNFTNLS